MPLVSKTFYKVTGKNFFLRKRMALLVYFLMNIAIFYLPRSWKETLTIFDESAPTGIFRGKPGAAIL